MNQYEYLQALSEATTEAEIDQLNEEGPIAWAKAKASNAAMELKGRHEYNKRMKAIAKGKKYDDRADMLKNSADERMRSAQSRKDDAINKARQKANDKSIFYGKYASTSKEERAATAEEKAAKKFDRKNKRELKGIKRDYAKADKFYKKGEKARGTSHEYEVQRDRNEKRWERRKRQMEEKRARKDQQRQNREQRRKDRKKLHEGVEPTAEMYTAMLIEACVYGIPEYATLSEGYAIIGDVIVEAYDELDDIEFETFVEAAIAADEELEFMIEDALDADLEEDANDYGDDDGVVSGLEEAYEAHLYND